METEDYSSINLSDEDSDNDSFSQRNFTVTENKKLDTKKLIQFIGNHEQEKKNYLNSSIINIIERNDYRAFRYLLENGYKLQVMNDKGQTALHLAFYHNSHAIFTLLKKDDFCKLIDDDYTDCNGLTHFHIACAKGHKELVETLQKYNPDINTRFHTDPKGLYSGFTPIHFAIMNCTRQRDQIVKFIIKCGADLKAEDSLERTALHLACSIFDRPRAHPKFKMSLKVIQLLIKEQHSNVNAKDANNNTPLLSIFPRRYNELGTYYLHESHESEFVDETMEKLNFLLKNGADVTVINNAGNNALHLILAILRRSRYTPSTELRRFINCYEVGDETFIEFSHFDVYYVEMIEKVLQCKQKIDVNARNNSDQSPLKLAVSCMNIDIVKMLLRSGADINSLKFDETNFFCYLNIIPNYDVVKILLNLLELLEANGFNMSLEDNLQVLKFIIHKNTDCNCGNTDLNVNNVKNLLYTGSLKHVIEILQKLSNDLKKVDYCHYFFVLGALKDYLDIVKAAKISVNIEVKNLAMKLITKEVPPREFTVNFGDDRYARRDAPMIESVVLSENLKLIDILMMDPEDIPYHIVNDYFSRKLVHPIHYCKEAIRGHMAKNIIRYYALTSANDYFEKLLGFSLPQLLSRKILNFMSNEDILNMCLAAMITDADNKM